MANIIQLNREDGSHFYNRDGTPCFEVPKKKGGGTTKTTLKHAKEMSLLVSPTTTLKQSAKPALTNWLITQACMTVLTAPRKDGEDDTQFVQRVLKDEEQHKAEGSDAAQRGSKIHAAIAEMLADRVAAHETGITEPAMTAVEWVRSLQIKPLRIEQTLTLNGVCGTCDLVGRSPDGALVVADWKSSNKAAKDMPTEAWPEHREQLGFYAASVAAMYKTDKIVCYVVYLSTTEPGAIAACEVADWRSAYKSFSALFDHWCYRNNYDPRRADMTIDAKLEEVGL